MNRFTAPDAECPGDEVNVWDHQNGWLLISVTEQDLPTELDGVLSLDQKLELRTRTVVLDTAGVVALAYRLEKAREKRIPAVKEWWEDRDNVGVLAEWLDFHGCLEDISHAIRLFAKPHKWTREYGLFQAYQAADSEELGELLVEAIHDTNQTAEDVVAEWNEEHEEEDR